MTLNMKPCGQQHNFIWNDLMNFKYKVKGRLGGSEGQWKGCLGGYQDVPVFPPQQRRALDNLIIIILKLKPVPHILTNYMLVGDVIFIGRVWKFLGCNQLLIYKVKKRVQTTHLSALLPCSTMGHSQPPFFLVLWSLLRRKKTRNFFQDAERCFRGFHLLVFTILWGMQDLSSLSRDWTCASCIRSAGSSLDH